MDSSSNRWSNAKLSALLTIVIATLAGWQIADFAHYDIFKGALLGFTASTSIVIAIGIVAKKLPLFDGIRVLGIYGGLILKVFASHHSPVWAFIGSAVSLISSIALAIRVFRRPKRGVRASHSS